MTWHDMTYIHNITKHYITLHTCIHTYTHIYNYIDNYIQYMHENNITFTDGVLYIYWKNSKLGIRINFPKTMAKKNRTLLSYISLLSLNTSPPKIPSSHRPQSSTATTLFFHWGSLDASAGVSHNSSSLASSISVHLRGLDWRLWTCVTPSGTKNRSYFIHPKYRYVRFFWGGEGGNQRSLN